MRNILRVLFLGSLALTTGYAFAAPPTITERPAGGTWVFDGVQYPFVCTFPLMMQGSGTEVTIDDLYGHGIARNFNFFPSFNVTLTDLRLGGRSLTFAALQANGETVNLTDGTAKFSALGPQLWIGDPDTGAQGLFETNGRLVWSAVWNPNGYWDLTSYERSGLKTDLCAALEA